MTVTRQTWLVDWLHMPRSPSFNVEEEGGFSTIYSYCVIASVLAVAPGVVITKVNAPAEMSGAIYIYKYLQLVYLCLLYVLLMNGRLLVMYCWKFLHLKTHFLLYEHRKRTLFHRLKTLTYVSNRCIWENKTQICFMSVKFDFIEYYLVHAC